jgi:nucleoside-diphosphate-sugar epimerase
MLCRDVALCHVLAMENPTAAGRYILIATSIAWRTAADILRKTLPSAKVPTEVDAGPAPPPQALSSIKKVHDLGVSYTPVEDSLRDCALSLYANGFLDGVIPAVGDPRQPRDGPAGTD